MAASQTYIAEGFLEDCKTLIEFLTNSYQQVDWHKFCYYWKHMQFDIIFYGRQSGPEVVEFTEELLQIARLYIVTETDNFEDQVIGIFIAYAITVIQPYKHLCSLRLVPDDVEPLKKIENIARRNNRKDILMILGKLYIYGNAQFHVSLRERAMDITIRKYFDDCTNVPNDIARSWYGKLNRLEVRECEHISVIEEKYLNKKMRARMVSEKKVPGTKVLIDTFKQQAKEIAESLSEMIAGPNKAETVEETYDVNTVKQRAMKKSVKPMGHLHGLAERKKASELVLQKTLTKAKSRKRCRKLSSPKPEQEPFYGFSLPDLNDPMIPDDPPDVQGSKRERSPEELFRGFTRQEIKPCKSIDMIGLNAEPTSNGHSTSKGKGSSDKTKEPSFYLLNSNRRRSPRGYGSKINYKVNPETQKRKMKMIKNRNNRKLRLSNDFNSDDSKVFSSDNNDSSDECNESEIIKKARYESANSDAETKSKTPVLVEKSRQVASDLGETCKGKEFIIQSKGIVKHFVEFELSDIVIRTEKGALPDKDIEIEYIDNYRGANAQLIGNDRGTNAFHEEICEVSDDEETKKEKHKVGSDGGIQKDYEVQVVVEECDEFGNEKQDDNLEVFQVISQDATDTVDTTFQTLGKTSTVNQTGRGFKNNYQNSVNTVEDTQKTLQKILNKHKTQGNIERRTLKQPKLRSKLKKMGLLPVANFEEDS